MKVEKVSILRPELIKYQSNEANINNKLSLASHTEEIKIKKFNKNKISGNKLNFLPNIILNLIKNKVILITLITLVLPNIIYSQDDFDIINNQIGYQQNNYYPDEQAMDYNGGYHDGMETPQRRRGGAHPGMRHMDDHIYGNQMGNERRFNNHPGMNGGNHRYGGRHYQNHGGINNQHFQSSQPQQMMNNNYQQGHGPFGIFGSSFANSVYEILMMIFLLGFVYNCFCGKNANDKHALAWYNANKEYFEERYTELGISKGENGEDEDPNNKALPIIKDSPYLYKFYAAGYRYIKWLLVVLEFRKRQDTISMFTGILFQSKDRIIYEVGIDPIEENVSWVFCVCNKKDANTLKRDHQDINFFCNTFEPSIMSDKLVLLSESDEMYCELFQNKVSNNSV